MLPTKMFFFKKTKTLFLKTLQYSWFQLFIFRLGNISKAFIFSILFEK